MVEPWGTMIEDHRFGTIASVVMAVNMDPKKSTPPSPLDFFPREREDYEEKQIAEDLAADKKLRLGLMEYDARMRAKAAETDPIP
jgi:hypothetical protein